MESMTQQPTSLAIVTAVAHEEGVDPTDLQPPLWDAIDPEALDRLVDGSGSSVAVTFRYRGYLVRVDPAGRVHLEEHPGAPSTD